MDKKYFDPNDVFNSLQIPEQLLLFKEISIYAKICFARLAQYSNRNHSYFCCIDQKTLSEHLCFSVSTIKKAIKELEDNGFIEVKRNKIGKEYSRIPNTYFLVLHECLKIRGISRSEVNDKKPMASVEPCSETEDEKTQKPMASVEPSILIYTNHTPILEDTERRVSSKIGEVDEGRPSASANESSCFVRRRNLTYHEKVRQLAKATRLQEKSVRVPRVTSDIREILDFWEECKLYSPKETTKDYAYGIAKAKKLLHGSLFDRKFALEEIKNSILRFSFAALDNDFEPSSPSYKKILSKTTLSKFIENAYSNNGNKSLFLKYLKEPPLPSKNKEEIVPDKYPTMTKNIMSHYKEKVVGRAKIKFSEIDENRFRKSAIMLKQFFKDNSDIMNPFMDLGDSSKVRLLFEAIEKDCKEDLSRISPGWLCSKETFNRRLPAYLFSQAVITDESNESSRFSIYDKQNEGQEVDGFMEMQWR